MNRLITSEKALYAGEKVADRVANETSVIAEKANDIKGKVHSMADGLQAETRSCDRA